MTPNDLSKLLAVVKKHYLDSDLEIISRAYKFAYNAHKDQSRENGEPVFNHVYNTALLLAGWKMTPTIITAGFLHDVTEDTSYSFSDLEKEFGEDVALIVKGETKLSRLKYRGMERYAENLRRMLVAMAEDARIIIVKFADRIDNLQTLNIFPPEKQKRIALESLEIYAPIANRLGMGTIRHELEDLSFKYVYPKEYEWVAGLIKDKITAQSDCLEKTQKIIKKDIEKADIKIISINSRTKGLYSLYKKLLLHARDINQIYDIFACRVIVPTIADCYAAMGVLHSRWKPLKDRIKDYIALPKPNGYQSLHTTVFCEAGEILEFQFRTPQMHEEAEYGIASHWFYKEHNKKDDSHKRQTAWMKELIEIQKNIQDNTKFLQTIDSLKIDIFKNRIFIFTPRGDVIDLPEGATPIDFAYAIHSSLGDKCVRAKINDKIAPLDTQLFSRDIVEIITDKNRKSPGKDWLKFVKTRNAKEKIKSQIKKSSLGDWIKGMMPKKS